MAGKWAGLESGLDGMIYCAPRSAARVLRIDPERETAEEIGCVSWNRIESEARVSWNRIRGPRQLESNREAAV